MRTAERPVAWEAWGDAALERARRDDLPVFLFLFASWSEACVALEDHVLASPPVALLLTTAFVTIKVNVDERPDIADRYGLGDWPSLLVLTPEGDVLTGGRDPDPAT